MSEWRPIDTAPRAANKAGAVGQAFLAFDGRRVAIVADQVINRDTGIRWWRCQAWAGEDAAFDDYGGPAPVMDHPTHWMPLPEPPK